MDVVAKHLAARRPEEQHPGCVLNTHPGCSFYCYKVVKVISIHWKCWISINILKNLKNFLNFMLDN